MEGIAEGIPVQMRFAGPEIELALVGDAIVTKAAAVLKNVEAAPKIQPVGRLLPANPSSHIPRKA